MSHRPPEASVRDPRPDGIRVLAGMVHLVAEQVERLAAVMSAGEAPLARSEAGDTVT